MRPKKTVVGIAWYKPENFDHLRSIFEDGDMLHDTHDVWLQDAERLCLMCRENGISVVKVDIDPVDFPKWCQENGMSLNAQARNRYAADFAAK